MSDQAWIYLISAPFVLIAFAEVGYFGYHLWRSEQTEPNPTIRILLEWCIAAQHSKCPGTIWREGRLNPNECTCPCHDTQREGHPA